MLAAMFRGRFMVSEDPDKGYVFIDRDGKHFRHILNWLRDGVVPTLTDAGYSELMREAEYYQLLGLIEGINSVLNKRKEGNELDAELTRADIIKCIQYKKVKFRGINFSGLDLSKLASLLGLEADLSYVDFSYASLQNVLFSRANLLCAKFRVGVISYSCNALCPEHLLIVFALYFPETCTVVTAMNSLDLTMSDVDAEGSIFHNATLRECEFTGANLRGAFLAGANLQSATLQDACLVDCNFCGANLRSAHLQTADLTNANFEGANLEGANLKGAKLNNANLKGANLQRAYLRHVNLQNAYGLYLEMAWQLFSKSEVPKVDILLWKNERPVDVDVIADNGLDVQFWLPFQGFVCNQTSNFLFLSQHLEDAKLDGANLLGAIR
ncbi:hypothetical protein POTOM_044135 [Populus tomentosa]|uniref:Potassium channel tetramerisation-type BTB domain-containing protein n=1 Tax=Populus tomentosa TaxID=118781 RepID=A0A8X7YL37_POPTO|nr:hypothetical protein POTOM_044135 [Populus tomentosa]